MNGELFAIVNYLTGIDCSDNMFLFCSDFSGEKFFTRKFWREVYHFLVNTELNYQFI